MVNTFRRLVARFDRSICEIHDKLSTEGIGWELRMTRLAQFLSRALYPGTGIAIAIALAIPPSHARPLPPNGPYGVLCTCGNLLFTSSNVVGNIGIGNGGAFIGSTADGPGTITGTVEFAAAQATPSQFSPNGITVTGGATFGNANVQTDISNIAGVSEGFRDEAGTPTLIIAGGSLNASTGIFDGNNEVFTATIDPNFVAGTTFTINGDGTGTQTVVLNITTGDLPFDGSIVLTGGLTSDEVLLNFDAGDYETGTGGDPLLIENGLPSADPATVGTYLDPNGPIQIIDLVIDGRVLGGGLVDDFVITDSTINAPALVPEPTPLVLLGAGLVALGIIRRRSRALLARS